MAHISKFIFDVVGEPHKNDPVIGCIQNGEDCACIDCAAHCKYRDYVRWEVA